MRLFVILLCFHMFSHAAEPSNSPGFTISINANNGTVGERVLSRNGQQSGESSFTTGSGDTFYTDKESYEGGKSLEINSKKGTEGFGSFGGIMHLPQYTHVGGRTLVKGDEIWVRLRIKLPKEFEFNNGSNKFMRLRVFHNEDGKKVSEGYNDLYFNGDSSTALPDPHRPFKYIFEGAQKWWQPQGKELFKFGEWNTVEYYLYLDDKKGSAGGKSMVRVWLNGKLLGETNDRKTLARPDSFMEFFYLFTWWGNGGARKTQKLWVDDIVVTSITPKARDAKGNPFVGTQNNPVSAKHNNNKKPLLP